jgi:hypothetical protein
MNEHSVVLYKKSGDPVRTDGRDIDSTIARLSGEASGQSAQSDLLKRAKATGKSLEIPADGPTYYGQPLLKQSVWSIDIPLYYFFGGAAGSTMALAAALQLRRDPELRKLSRHCHWIGITGSTLGAAFLIHDLGRPSRFMNMLRVFRPTSPMNVGAWILSVAAPSAIATGLFIGRRGLAGLIGETTGYISGAFGAALAGYTGVLVANSAIPVWQQARAWMPVLFVASSITSAASVLDIFYESREAQRITYTFGTIGRLAEIAAGYYAGKSCEKLPSVAAPFRSGATGLLWKTSTALAAASLVISALPGKSSRPRRKIAGLVGALGSLALRFAVHYISNASARDPRASFQQQRAAPRLTPQA